MKESLHKSLEKCQLEYLKDFVFKLLDISKFLVLGEFFTNPKRILSEFSKAIFAEILVKISRAVPTEISEGTYGAFAGGILGMFSRGIPEKNQER